MRDLLCVSALFSAAFPRFCLSRIYFFRSVIFALIFVNPIDFGFVLSYLFGGTAFKRRPVSAMRHAPNCLICLTVDCHQFGDSARALGVLQTHGMRSLVG